MQEDANAAQTRREEIRLAARTYLYERPAIAPRLAAIVRGIKPDTGAGENEVLAAILFLVSAGQAEAVTMPLGASRGYQITAAGMLAHERGE